VPQADLARFYTAHSYVFFLRIVEDRSLLGVDYIQDLVAQVPPYERARRMVELQQADVDDVIAGMTYLKSQPFVDPTRIAISGCSYGGIQTLLIGERTGRSGAGVVRSRRQWRGTRICRFERG